MITFTPLSGPARSPRTVPLAYLLQVDDVRILLDCGSPDWCPEAIKEEEGESAVEAAQRAFKTALMSPKGVNGVSGSRGDGETGAEFHGVYRRTDKINYEFGGYDLAFASFELRS